MEVLWFNNQAGTIGIVLSENSVGQKKAYIAKVDGRDEKADIEFIKNYGAKIKIGQARQILAHLDNPEIN